ncbi:MAG: metallophosphoesterase family protein [Planctomycetota bacterium]|jgi:3',5'-cyclic AMP phosphodiesterase CpdA
MIPNPIARLATPILVAPMLIAWCLAVPATRGHAPGSREVRREVPQAASERPTASALDRFESDGDGGPLERQVVEVPPRPSPLRLAILPDRTTGRAWGLPYLETAVEDLRRIGPDAIFTIGDMVQGYTRSTAQWDREADEWFEIASGLPSPAWPVAGNHDVVSGTRDPADSTFEDRYRERFGPLRYAVEFDRATVVVLYSEGRRAEEGVALSPEDLAWLDETLAHAAARGVPTVLLTHRPMWRYRSADWDERVHPLLAEHGVDAVVAGHFHALQRDPDRDGVQYHVLGSCGGLIDQHPASGQLQHLTFLTVAPDAAPEEQVRIHHQLVGATLAGDHLLREDQDRAWRMKRAADAATIVGAVAEPSDGAADSGTLRLDLANPLDVPIVWTWRPLTARPEPAPVEPLSAGGLAWSSRTPVDTFNPFTMRTDSPLSLAAGGPVELAPGERRSVDLPWTVTDGTDPLPPTELRLQARYRDSRGRAVPVTVVRRVPVARERILPVGDPLELPISAWEFSPYDLPEPDPTAAISRLEDGGLMLNVLAPGDRLAGTFEDWRLDRDRFDDPMQDAIRIELGDGPGTRSLLFELLPDSRSIRAFALSADGEATPIEVRGSGPAALQARWRPLGEGWTATIAIPAEDAGAGVLPLQVGVADNDDTYHTQWRWLAPKGHPVRLLRPDPDGPAMRITP